MTCRSALLAVMALALAPPLAGQSRQGLVSLPDARIFYEVIGEGDPVVVVHGGPGMDHRYLRPGLDILASDHALVYYDQRGTGRSAAELDSASIHLDAFVADIEALRQALGHERVTVLGHSFGGLIAMGYALAHPDRTRALVLLNTVEPGSRFREETMRRSAALRGPEDLEAMRELLSSAEYARRDPATLSRFYRLAFRGTLRNPSHLDELNLEMAPATARNGPDVARLLGGSVSDLDWWGRLESLAVPTLVVAGRHDPTPLPMAEALAGAIPGARLAVLETGHFPYVEDPSALAAAVASFLVGVTR